MRHSDIKVAAKIESVTDARDLATRRLPEGIFQMFEAAAAPNAPNASRHEPQAS